jgi:hypothetical protein
MSNGANPKYEYRNPKQIRRRRTSSNNRNTNPPKADKIQNKEDTDWFAFCPKTKDSLPFLDADLRRFTLISQPQKGTKGHKEKLDADCADCTEKYNHELDLTD